MTAGPEICLLCGQRALIDQGDGQFACAKCDSVFERDGTTGRRRYTRVASRYRPIASQLSGAWLGREEVVEAGRSLALQRARWLVTLSAGIIATVALFACALGAALALAPGIRDSQARIAQANASVTGTLTAAAPTGGAAATLRPAVTLTPALAAPSQSPSPTSPGPLNSPLPTPSARAPAPTGTRFAPGESAVPTPRSTEASAPIVLPPTFTPAATLRLATPTLAAAKTATAPPSAPTATRAEASTAVTVTPTLEPTPAFTATPTPGPASDDPTPSATATATATPAGARSKYIGQVRIRAVNYLGTPSQNEADEYIELENTGATNVDIRGWAIRHRLDTSTVAIPQMTLVVGQTCRIYTAAPAPAGACGPLVFGNFQNLWPNDRDTLRLLDATSLLVDEYTYP